MGNSTSNAANANNHNNHLHPSSRSRYESPTRRTQSPTGRGGSPSPSSNRVHKSLRNKKKSLELPDLASLALTPASTSPGASPHAGYRRPRASSPIPIPISPKSQVPGSFRVQNNFASAAQLALNQNGRGSRYKSYLSSAYPSTHSFVSGDQEQGSPPRQDPPTHEFVPELVHSTIPLALPKAEGDFHRPEHVTVTIKWRGGGKSVVLARAGDDYWKGRQPMEHDADTKTWYTQIHVLPGTHHFKFIVDDQWRIADDYPTAVDDIDGSLANYVNATSPSSVSPSSSSPQPTPHPNQIQQFASFWSDASSSARENGTSREDGGWTTEIPQELINAAAEEENYLASQDSPTTSSSVPAPNVPPAPTLPRHLDKLILNARPQISGAPGSPSERDRRREKEKEKERRRRERDREGRRAHAPSSLGMTSTTMDGGDAGALPVVTASGAEVMAHAASSPPPTPGAEGGAQLQGHTPSKRVANAAKLETPGLADDGSVLPVPSHVVLHHLSTSAIRNGVLAVANTTRYRKKYITTIYYKPT
ncbi:hypothetical protein PsYK624_043970 [Phanerochaete sordida]|uniref:Association with the SNF1 complex (ASC) domain-containing protein n=1 Tax=Phanerochaete sordida TaxID=48140 RepID=A0A9P3LB88_9APHY|nr:hypothetical protein PsYK624_043970 [Phanerochaete sordida]